MTMQPLFEVNLIAGHVEVLRRRQLMARVVELTALVVFLLAAFVALYALEHGAAIVRRRQQISKLKKDHAVLSDKVAVLDKMRDDLVQNTEIVAPLLPVAEQRVAWAPKLAALATSLPAGMGIMEVQTANADFFIPSQPKPASKPNRATENSTKTPQRTKKNANAIQFKVVYHPKIGSTTDPMDALRENLLSSDVFMKNMTFVQLISSSMEDIQEKDVLIFEGVAEGDINAK